jgi:hypothetical protein
LILVDYVVMIVVLVVVVVMVVVCYDDYKPFTHTYRLSKPT